MCLHSLSWAHFLALLDWLKLSRRTVKYENPPWVSGETDCMRTLNVILTSSREQIGFESVGNCPAKSSETRFIVSVHAWKGLCRYPILPNASPFIRINQTHLFSSRCASRGSEESQTLSLSDSCAAPIQSTDCRHENSELNFQFHYKELNWNFVFFVFCAFWNSIMRPDFASTRFKFQTEARFYRKIFVGCIIESAVVWSGIHVQVLLVNHRHLSWGFLGLHGFCGCCSSVTCWPAAASAHKLERQTPNQKTIWRHSLFPFRPPRVWWKSLIQ